MTRELKFEQITDYLLSITNYPTEVIRQYYFWDDSRLTSDFSITFNIVNNLQDLDVLETITIDMCDVWNYSNTND